MTLNQAWNEYEAAMKSYKAIPSQANEKRVNAAEEMVEGLQNAAEFDAANESDMRD